MKYIFSIFIALTFSSLFPTSLLTNELVESSISKAPPTVTEKIFKKLLKTIKIGMSL